MIVQEATKWLQPETVKSLEQERQVGNFANIVVAWGLLSGFGQREQDVALENGWIENLSNIELFGLLGVAGIAEVAAQTTASQAKTPWGMRTGLIGARKILEAPIVTVTNQTLDNRNLSESDVAKRCELYVERCRHTAGIYKRAAILTGNAYFLAREVAWLSNAMYAVKEDSPRGALIRFERAIAEGNDQKLSLKQIKVLADKATQIWPSQEDPRVFAQEENQVIPDSVVTNWQYEHGEKPSTDQKAAVGEWYWWYTMTAKNGVNTWERNEAWEKFVQVKGEGYAKKRGMRRVAAEIISVPRRAMYGVGKVLGLWKDIDLGLV